MQDRAAGGLNRVVHDQASPKYGTVYGGRAEDANIAWVAAAAYRYEWSCFHQNTALREEAFFLLDSLARIHGDGRWDDGGLASYFGLQSFAWAVLSWLENGSVEETRAVIWRAAVAAAANDAMRCMGRNPCAGQYANPEFYYLSGLAAAWKVCGDERYLEEATRALKRYENVLFEGGGVSYFHQTNPQHGYQQMVSKSVLLYWDLVQDPYSRTWIERLGPYFVNVQHPSGLVTDAEQSWLKHSFYNPVNPAVPGMFACVLQDGKSRTAAETAARLRADNVVDEMPSFLPKNPNWYNYHHTTYAAAFLRVLEKCPLPEPEPLPARRVFRDRGFAGVRSHWDDFAAAVGVRQKNDALAGAYVADPGEPMMPLGSAVDGVFSEILCGDRSQKAPAHVRSRSRYGCLEWYPWTHFVETVDVAAVSCRSRLCSPYWNDLPWLPGERWRLNEVSGWSEIQHWAVWRDHLVGFCALRCHEAGGDVETADVAQIRWRLAPVGRELTVMEDTPVGLALTYGKLRVEATLLGEKGGFAFSIPEGGEPPHASSIPAVRRPAPWGPGDFVHVGTDMCPSTSDSGIVLRALKEAAAAIMLEPDGRRAHIWVASLTRHLRQHHLLCQTGWTVRVFERDVELTPPLPGERGTVSLHGGESALMEVVCAKPVTAEELAEGLQSGWGRGEARPKRE